MIFQEIFIDFSKPPPSADGAPLSKGGKEHMRINKKFILKSAIYALIFIFFTILETNMLNGLKIFGAKPNLVISLVIAAAVAENERYAAVLGMIFGFLIDSSVGSPFFFSGIYYFFAAYMAAAATRYYFSKSLLT